MERRTTIYSLILVLLGIALVVVMVLVLRKRAALPSMKAVGQQQNGDRKVPPPSKPIESYIPERSLQEGDPVPPPTYSSPPGGQGES